MSETLGVIIAIVSSCLGGMAAAVTRYLVSGADAVTLVILRWGIGFLCVLPVALVLRVHFFDPPKRKSRFPRISPRLRANCGGRCARRNPLLKK